MNDELMDALEWFAELAGKQPHEEAKAQAYSIWLCINFIKAFDLEMWAAKSDDEQEAFLRGFVPLCGGE